jgi:hypothetical protein
MAQRARPILRLHLRSPDLPAGEIPLEDLVRVATKTQAVVRRLARGIVGQRGPGRAGERIEEATQLTLIGLRSGSTVLEIAGVEDVAPEPDGIFDLPAGLGSRALDLLMDGVSALTVEKGSLPLGVDAAAIGDIDQWLRSLAKYAEVGVDLSGPSRDKYIEIVPRVARQRLRTLETQPSVPFVSSTEQAIEGSLYALNTHTGIEDDAGHKLRLSVPEDLRADAALLVTRRVRAIGVPDVDEHGGLRSFTVTRLVPAPDLAALHEQGRFFERHELRTVTVSGDRSLDSWAIEGITQAEADEFMSAISE